MSPEWTITPFDPETATRPEWDAYHAYRRIRGLESEPDEPVAPDDVAEANMKRPDIHGINKRNAAWIGGEMVGYCGAWAPIPGTPEYETNKHLGWVFGGVVEAARGQGIGSALIQKAAEFMRKDDQKILNIYAHEQDGVSFLDHLGAECKQVERESRLYFKDIDWEQVQRWRSELAERAPGTTIEIYTDPLPEELVLEYCEARTEMMNLMPWDDLEHGEIVITPEDVNEWEERMKLSNSEHHTIISREPDGKIGSITDVAWRPHKPAIISQWFTGVHPAARGKGIGKAIKAEMVHFLNERYDGLEWIDTGNAATNEAMLAINNRMGFKEHKRYNAYQVDREMLLESLEARSER